MNVNESKDSGVALCNDVDDADNLQEKKGAGGTEREAETRSQIVNPPSAENGMVTSVRENGVESGQRDGDRHKGLLRKMNMHKG